MSDRPYIVDSISTDMDHSDLSAHINNMHKDGFDLIGASINFLVFKERPEPLKCTCNSFEETHFVDCELFGDNRGYRTE